MITKQNQKPRRHRTTVEIVRELDHFLEYEDSEEIRRKPIKSKAK